MQTSKLFTLLPEELVCTPDGMAIDRDGNLILSCPNFADLSMPSCVLKIDKDRNIKKWFDVPRNEYTGEARAMGIEFGPDGDLYLVDNAGWTGEPHMVFTGRILRLRLNDAGVVKCTVVADNMEHPNGIRIWGDYMYVTQSCMTRQKTDSGKLMSCVYRFPLDAEGIHCTNTLADPHIFLTFITENPKCQYGVDGIVFDHVFAIANNPLGRFGNLLHKTGNLERYMNKLVGAFNPDTVPAMMCRSQLSVGWDGTLYDCDFNQAAGLPCKNGLTIAELAADPSLPLQRDIAFGNHCYACCAGAGSS